AAAPAPILAAMARFALSAVGRDRPGIVAAVSGVLADHGLNIEDSRMTILGGHFTMMLIVSAPPGLDAEALRSDLGAAAGDLSLEAVSLSEVAEDAPPEDPPSHILSVYGADHPGIVRAVSSALAERRVNITDLETRLTAGDGERPLYVMMLEVRLPPSLSEAALEEALAGVAREQGLDLTVRPLEPDVL
ncbi:MAG: ACT domain-containing protein, partial [Actinomycetota bacterium]|nr:ACT domain-containing protein [Actinomycetota bacterium]